MNVSPHEDDDLSSMPLARRASHEELQKAAGGPGTESLIKGQDKSRLQLAKSDELTKKPHAKEVALKMGEKKKRRKKKWKKPKDKPSRPLSAYNLFFQHERAIMLGKDAPTDADEEMKKRVHCKTHGKIGFADMARSIGSKWKSMDAEAKKMYETQASAEKMRYTEELAAWKEEQKSKSQMGDDTESVSRRDSVAIGARASNSVGAESSSSAGLMEQSQPSAAGKTVLSDFSQHRMSESHMPSAAMPQSNMSLEYLRALREQRQLDAALFGRQFESPLMQYPNAAEASANILMQHFQGQASVAQLPHASLDALMHLQTGVAQDRTRAQSSLDALMQQIQNEQAEIARKQESVEALMQQLHGGGNTDTVARSQALPQAASVDALLQQYQAGLPPQELLQHALPSRQLDLSLQNMGMYSPNMAATAMRQLQQRYARGRGNDFNFQAPGGGGDFPPSGR
jgi:hypothetical protein